MNQLSLKKNLKRVLPDFILLLGRKVLLFRHFLLSIKRKYELKKHYSDVHKRYRYNLHILNMKMISGNEKIRCVYFALFPSIWKCDEMYQMMKNDDRFEPLVLVCPIIIFGRENMLQNMEDCYNQMKEKGYNVKKAYDSEKDKYIDVCKDLNPDIIVYTNPYEGLIDNRYYIKNFENILTIYIPYFFGLNIEYNMFNNLYLHNIVWRLYCETPVHKGFYQNYQYMKGKNVYCTGYPGIDVFLKNNPIHNQKTNEIKTIIWAPHHTIKPVGKVNFSCFIKYSEFMIEMAKKFEDKALFVFKPHPLLRIRLNLLWGKDKTDAYYLQWETMPNTSINEGEYVDLFLKSDAMIHDSGSFLTEYLYTHKPVMRTMNDVDPKTMYNDFALDVLDVYYKAYNELDIEQFIQNVIDGVDPMKEAREKFYKERLLPPNGKLPSENIINDIIDSIKNQRVFAE